MTFLLRSTPKQSPQVRSEIKSTLSRSLRAGSRPKPGDGRPASRPPRSKRAQPAFRLKFEAEPRAAGPLSHEDAPLFRRPHALPHVKTRGLLHQWFAVRTCIRRSRRADRCAGFKKYRPPRQHASGLSGFKPALMRFDERKTHSNPVKNRV